MNYPRTFSLAEAKSLLPELKAMLVLAKNELNHHGLSVQAANSQYKLCQNALASVNTKAVNPPELTELRGCRQDFQKAIENLSAAQHDYLECLSTWTERISNSGVLLRDLRTGLLDFPAKDGQFEYFLCWRLDEEEIAYWHLANDGFTGRRPLAVLSEYV
jgi:hypothetical protein